MLLWVCLLCLLLVLGDLLICVGYCEFWVSPDFVSWLKILAVFIAWVLGFYCVLLALSSCYSDFYLDNLNFIS